MHAPAASARATCSAPEEFGDQLNDWKAFRKRVPVATVRAEDDVTLPQVRADANGDGFLPDRGVASTVNQAALVITR
jgi:hypothetical protein